MPEPLKNLFNRPLYDRVSDVLESVYPEYDRKQFLNLIFDEEWDNRELKQRMRHTSICLGKVLPNAFPEALDVLKRAAGLLREMPPKDMGFLGMFFPDFVAVFGIEQPELSIPALADFTSLASSEFAIRPFIIRYPDVSMESLLKWAEDENHHVRRLASEGSRPRLPWAMTLPAFIKDPAPVLQILEKLKDDPELYVRRSVANNLNDIAKDNPDSVLKTLRRWNKSASKERQWILKHATRTLIKAGNPGALELLGFSPDPKVEIREFCLQPEQISMGEAIEITFEVHSLGQEEQALVIDYVVHFMKSNGKQAPKVFKLTEKRLVPGKSLFIRKKHAVKPITTRKYYPGMQRVEIQVNGKSFGELSFELV